MNLFSVGTGGLEGSANAVTVGIRAEHVRVAPGDVATVVAVDDLGHERIAELDIGGGVMLVRLPRGIDLQRGQRTGFAVDRAHVHSFDAGGRAIS